MENKKENKVDINVATELLRQKLVEDINSSGLPISTLYLIVKELMWSTEKSYYAALNAPVQQAIEKSNKELSKMNIDKQEESE